jgi:large subunit ribosomal protein L10
MAITRQKKEEILAELVKKFQDSKSVAFGQYAGMSVSDLAEMRGQMREVGVEFKVAKKTLMRLAAKEIGLELPDEILEGTIGVAFSYDDVVSGPKALKTTSKTHEVVKLMGGIMDGKVLSFEEIQELASLASREELLAKFVGMISAPLQNFYGGISSPMSSFARTLSEYGKQLPDEGAAEPEEITPGSESEPVKNTVEDETPVADAEPAQEPAAEEAEKPADDAGEDTPAPEAETPAEEPAVEAEAEAEVPADEAAPEE